MIFIEKLKVLELFSGTQSISKAFRKVGHETFTIDFDEVFKEPEYENTDLYIDILEVTPEMVLERFGRPDVIWASPPCQAFSVAAIGRNWSKDGDTYTPTSERAELALQIVEHTLYLIEKLQPKYWFIENPRGMLRKVGFMTDLPRYTITYCQYGDSRMKPTDIWTNLPDPQFKPPCKNGASCHIAAPRGSRTGTQGLKNAIERARIPKEFCEHVARICF